MSCHWWRYFEVDSYEDEPAEKNDITAEEAAGLQLDLIREVRENEMIDAIMLNNADTPQVSFTVPEDARPGDTIHIIVEVQDDGAHGLKAYQRVILTVDEHSSMKAAADTTEQVSEVPGLNEADDSMASGSRLISFGRRAFILFTGIMIRFRLHIPLAGAKIIEKTRRKTA